MSLAGKQVSIHNIPGPTGVRGRNSDNRLIAEKLGWQPSHPLAEGLAKTYAWISQQVAQTAGSDSLASLGKSVNAAATAVTVTR
jgi:GDP-D-mannose 3', 5'-epimerase